MPNRALPSSSRYTGFYNDMVNNTLLIYDDSVLAATVANGVTTLASATLTTATIPALTVSTTLIVPQAVTIGGIAYTFPADNGDAGEQLETDGAGVLTWEAAT